MSSGLTKVCTKCATSKPTSEYYKDARAVGGLYPWCKTCFLDRKKRWYDRNVSEINERKRDRREILRLDALIAYGGDDPACACCGEPTYEFLCIDHINGHDGSGRGRDQSGTNLYQWLKMHSYPSGFRVLCNNCNMSLGDRGYCPHQAINEEAYREQGQG